MEKENIKKIVDDFKREIRSSLSMKGYNDSSRMSDYYPKVFEYKALEFVEKIEKELINQ
ncbi:hypothetical protein [Clostridium saudiense]|uniref:hypothetical protein n=1 Tax=Clostridium saudiense TaxID=1414720 RepID=UPI0026DD35C8|nr:hypothetical protein [uncultured Clostridium sp.]